MKPYIGTKRVNATPMTRAAYNELRGWSLPANEDGSDEGYLVEYTDGGAPNMPGQFVGYVSWSPKAQFEGAYKDTAALPFSAALAALKTGSHICRAGWNGKGMFLFLDERNWAPALGYQLPGLPFIIMKTADSKLVPWLASQTDILAEDWQVV